MRRANMWRIQKRRGSLVGARLGEGQSPRKLNDCRHIRPSEVGVVGVLFRNDAAGGGDAEEGGGGLFCVSEKSGERAEPMECSIESVLPLFRYDIPGRPARFVCICFP